MENCPHCGNYPAKCRCQLRTIEGCVNGSCSCNHQQQGCACKKTACPCKKRAYLASCPGCDACQSCESMVRICTFVSPNLEDAKHHLNSFVFNQEDDAVYYIDANGTETPFGARPMFIDDYDKKVKPRQIVFDFKNAVGYVGSPEGKLMKFALEPVEEE